MEKARNVFTSCLSSLGVKYTKTFAESFFGEHPLVSFLRHNYINLDILRI